MSYKIVRLYGVFAKHGKRTIDSGLTLEQAQAHCQDPETSSTTATKYKGRKLTERYGVWFDSYTEE